MVIYQHVTILTIYARNPTKLPAEIRDHTKVTVVEGQLDNEVALKKAVDAGARVFISFAGPVMGSKGTVSSPWPWFRLKN